MKYIRQLELSCAYDVLRLILLSQADFHASCTHLEGGINSTQLDGRRYPNLTASMAKQVKGFMTKHDKFFFYLKKKLTSVLHPPSVTGNLYMILK